MKNYSAYTLRVSARSLLFSALLWFGQPKASSRAADSFTFKNQSWQEADNRIRVDSQTAMLEANLTSRTRLKLMGTIDTIAGATPTGENPAGPGIAPVLMAGIDAIAGASGSTPAAAPGSPYVPRTFAAMNDKRKAWSMDLAQQFNRINVSLGVANSREIDYVSDAYSLNTLTDFNQKNTSLLFGYARTDDVISGRLIGWTITRPKTSDDFITGITQVINADTTLTANLFYGQASGFLGDPYKVVSTTKLKGNLGFYYTVPENRPTSRDKGGIFIGLNRNYERWHAAAEGTYRYYQDNFGITSHTLSALWIQKLGAHVTLQPSLRYYRQSAADFYYSKPDTAGIATSREPLLGETGTGLPPYYSSDYRLSQMQTIDAGLKITWQIRSWLEMDVAYNRYTSRGLDQVTPQTMYSRANVFTLGFRATR